jgi:hypothetical protein
MGYMRHHAIVVTASDYVKNEKQISDIKKIRDKAVEIFGSKHKLVSTIIPAINCYGSFFIAPDGSKEGWEDSDLCDKKRDKFLKWLQSQDKKGVYSDWAEIQFGDDERINFMIRNNDEPMGKCYGK